MRSKLLFSVTTLLGCCIFYSSSALAFGAINPALVMPMAPPKSMDIGRSVTGILQGILTMTQDGEVKADLIAVQTNINTNADGTGDWELNPNAKGSVTQTPLQNGAYDYIKTQLLDKTDLSSYKTLQTALSNSEYQGHSLATCETLGWQTDNAKQTCAAIVNTFFTPFDDTDTNKVKAQKQRQEYANQVSPRFIRLAYETQQKLIKDLEAASSAPVASENEVGSIANDGQTLDEMIKITVADLALQVEMMEADAMAFLLQQPVGIMPSEKPINE